MANWGIASGIGQGIMQGLQFNRQLDADKRTQQALENQTELLGMQKDLHREKMGALTRENEERQRVDVYNTLRTRVESVYSDLPEYDRQKMVIDNALGAGIIKPAELELAKKNYDAAISVAGVDAYDATTRGDVAPLNKILASKGLGSAALGKDGTVSITGLDGSVKQLKQSDLLNLQIMSGAYDREAARAKARLDARKTEAEITRTLADANMKDRLPLEKIPGSGSGSGSGKGGKQQPDPSAMFSADAYLERFGVGKDSDPAFRARGDDGFGFYQMLHKANPDIAGTPDGNEMMFRLSRDIMNGSVQRDTKFDPNTMSWNRYVTDSQGGRYKLDRSSIDPRQLKGPDGKPAIEPSVIEQEEMSALKRFSTSRPDKYRLAASLAQAKELTTDELLAAANGMPVSSGSRSVSLSPELANVALMIRRRGMEQPGQKRFVPGGVKRALPDTAGYGAGGSKGTSLAGEAFDKYVADPVTGFFKESARQAREE